MLRAKSLITDPQPLRPHNIKWELGGANKAIARVAGLADSRPRYQEKGRRAQSLYCAVSKASFPPMGSAGPWKEWRNKASPTALRACKP